PFPSRLRTSQILVAGNTGFRVLYSLNIAQYSREYVTNFYLDPGGEKFLMYESTLIPIGRKQDDSPIVLRESDYQKVQSDIEVGLKGFYEVKFQKDGKSLTGVLAQYPFWYANASTPASLVFFVPMEGLTSGIYSTYFYLFMGVAILLIGTAAFFIISLKWNVDS